MKQIPKLQSEKRNVSDGLTKVKACECADFRQNKNITNFKYY